MAGNTDNLDFLKKLNEMQDSLNKKMSSSLDFDSKILIQEESIANQKRIQAEQERLISESKKKNSDLNDDEKKELDRILSTQKDINKEVDKESKTRRLLNTTLSEFNSQIKLGWQYLMQNDKVIKTTVLNLGLSGQKADDMRASFEQSAGFVASLGGSLEDVQNIMQGFADETGKARALSAEMVDDITMIGKGTGLGIEQATKLGGQFEFMGANVKSTMNYVQGIVDTSERMGINTTKVLKNLNDNFKKLNSYTFQSGSKGMAIMAMNAEKTRVSIEDTINAAAKGRTLEGAIDMMAQLQVMGGEFAKTDPLEFMYNARNNPEKINDQISLMTKGLVTLKRQGDGTFEKIVSPADIDRLEGVGKALGISREQLVLIAQKRFDIDKAASQMAGTGLSGREKELLAGAATFNSSTAKYEVMLAGHMRDVSTLTKSDAQLLVTQTKTLKQRAIDAQTFEDAFNNTIKELKAALLPVLKSINSVLSSIRPIVAPFIKAVTSGPAAWAKVAALFVGVGVMWKGILQPFMQRMGAATIGKLATRVRGAAPVAEAATTIEGGAAQSIGNANAGKGLMRGGAGIGAAALGIGAGIGAAAVGISKLADAMSKLDKTQIAALPKVILAMAAAIAAFTVPLIFLAPVLDGASLGLLALGAAALGIGAGIGFAATGIGKMAEGLSTLVTAGKGAGTSLLSMGAGIASMAAGMALFTVGGIGMLVFGKTMKTISENASGVAMVGNAFQQIGVAMKGSKDDFQAIQNAVTAISKVNTKGGGMLADLANLLKSPLKVEFSNKEVAVVSNITMNIDGQKFHQAVKTGAYVRNENYNAKSGKQTGG